jgi:hypothetical protein
VHFTSQPDNEGRCARPGKNIETWKKNIHLILPQDGCAKWQPSRPNTHTMAHAQRHLHTTAWLPDVGWGTSDLAREMGWPGQCMFQDSVPINNNSRVICMANLWHPHTNIKKKKQSGFFESATSTSVTLEYFRLETSLDIKPTLAFTKLYPSGTPWKAQSTSLRNTIFMSNICEGTWCATWHSSWFL